MYINKYFYFVSIITCENFNSSRHQKSTDVFSKNKKTVTFFFHLKMSKNAVYCIGVSTKWKHKELADPSSGFEDKDCNRHSLTPRFQKLSDFTVQLYLHIILGTYFDINVNT